MRMIKLLDSGVELPRRAISERMRTAWAGHLEVVETSDQGRHRTLRVARFHLQGAYTATHSLFDPHLVWWSGSRFVLAGFERIDRDGQTIQCAQSWLCLLEENARSIEPVKDAQREAKREAAALRN
jgi:hypothetical protein